MTGNELKKRREALGLSQQDLARELNDLGISTVARWEQLKNEEITNKLLEPALQLLESKKK